jgi:glycosyltransferase involved in cell wall biosynthesis
MATQESRLKIMTQSNCGAHCTINRAIEQASGEYVSILNSDDSYHPSRVQSCLDLLKQNPEASGVATGLEFIDASGRSTKNSWYKNALRFYYADKDMFSALINANFIMTTSNLFLRRSAFNAVGGFANLRYAHDLDFFLRLVHDNRLLWLETPLLQYRMHGTNTINENVMHVKIEWAAVVAWHLFQNMDKLSWAYMHKIMQITDSHHLTRLLFCFLLEYKKNAHVNMSVDSFWEDEDFVSFLREVVR